MQNSSVTNTKKWEYKLKKIPGLEFSFFSFAENKIFNKICVIKKQAKNQIEIKCLQ